MALFTQSDIFVAWFLNQGCLMALEPSKHLHELVSEEGTWTKLQTLSNKLTKLLFLLYICLLLAREDEAETLSLPSSSHEGPEVQELKFHII